MAKDKGAPKKKQRWSTAQKKTRDMAENPKRKFEFNKSISKGRKVRTDGDTGWAGRGSDDARPTHGSRRPDEHRGSRPYHKDERSPRTAERFNRRFDEAPRRDYDRREGGWKRDDRGAGRPAFGDRRDRNDGPPRRWENRDDRGGERRSSWSEDRPRRDDRAPRGGGFDNRRDDRGGFNRDDRRDDRGGFRRDDRRDDRGSSRGAPWENRDDRSRGDRNDGPPRRWENRDDRGGERRSSWSEDRPRRDDRPRGGGFNNERPREDRGGFRRDDRRDDRGSSRGAPWEKRDDRPRRDDRGAFNREDRPRRDDRFNRDDRPRRDMNDDFAADRDDMSWEQTEEVTEGSATTAFADYGLPTPIVTALSGKGIETPFPIQAATIPDALAGKDILARAQTGSGKTLGFGLPMLARLDKGERGRYPRGVILAPTRELAVQVADELAPMAVNLGLRMVLVAGGMGFGPQLKAFRKGVDIVVATPGRLIDLMEQGEADLSQVEMLVLDEADHMSDLGFLPAVTQVMESVKEDAQKLLFSATLDDAVSRIVKKFLHNPVTHQVDENRASVTTMTHVVWHVETREKVQIAAKLAHRPGRTLVFVRTQRGADRIAQDFQEAGVLAAALHGGLTQGQRVRTLNAFKNSTLPVLIATDVAARGIHVDDVSLVLQYDPPANEKDYLHRAGRTARAGRDGLVASLVQQSQRRSVQRMLRMAGLDVPPRRVRLDDEELLALTGAHDFEGEPIAPDTVKALLAPPAQVRSQRKGGFGGGNNRRRGGGFRGGGGQRRG